MSGKRIRIKDIAKKAGVSPGTVDRVLHKRGNVSKEALDAVNKVLKEVDYKPNIHISALSLKKDYKIVITTPEYKTGEYWESIHNGIEQAIEKFSNIKIKCSLYLYNQFDVYSCRKIFEQVVDTKPDAVIIGPTFIDETTNLTERLDENKVPYIFLDSTIEGCNPVSFFSCDHFKCGFLTAKLISLITPKESEIILFQAVRTGDQSSNASILRRAGFMHYCKENNIADKITKKPFSVMEPKQNKTLIGELSSSNPQAKGAVVLNSRGGMIADYLRSTNSKDMKLVCIDLTKENRKAVEDGYIEFTIAQRPEQQGFMAFESMIHHLIYNSVDKKENYMPLDIITQENIEFYLNFNQTDQ